MCVLFWFGHETWDDTLKLALAFAFLLTAVLYASVGFGGGSSYTAFLAITATSFTLIPIISLLCNICVVSGNSWRYLRLNLVRLSDVAPLFILSIPAALMGGMLHVSETVYIGLLSLGLFVASLRMILAKNGGYSRKLSPKPQPMFSALIGALIGFFSGIVGIGGGIFLAPVLYRLRWGSAQQIAAACSVFIFVNSIAGLAGQLIKTSIVDVGSDILSYWFLILAVLVGGAIGNTFSLRVFNERHLRRITGIVILIVSVRLMLKWARLMSWI